MKKLLYILILVSSQLWGQDNRVKEISSDTVYFTGTLGNVVRDIGKEYVETRTLLTRNTDVVEAGGYLTITTDNYNFGFRTGGRSVINRTNLTRVRQPGQISKIQFALQSKDLITSLWFDVWRKDGTTYDAICHVDVFALSSPGINTITLPSPISVVEGDYIGIAGIGTQTSGQTELSSYGAGTAVYYTSNELATGNDYPWASKSSLAVTIPLKTFQQAPMVVGIGNSIMAGHPGHYSYVENSLTSDITNQILYQLQQLDPYYVYQNMGIGSQTVSDLYLRSGRDLVNLKPKIAIIEGGVNDIAAETAKSTFLSFYEYILDSCETHGIVPVVMKITPWTDGSNAQMQTRDTWMSELEALVATYDGSVWVDLDATVGKFREGGDVGNLWDIQDAYDQDGIHFNKAGYTAIAVAINTAIKLQYRFE